MALKSVEGTFKEIVKSLRGIVSDNHTSTSSSAAVSVEDTFRAIVDSYRAIVSDGLYHTPMGHFAVVEIPEDDAKRTEMRRVVFAGDNETFDGLEAGWYFVIQPSPDALTYDKCENRDYALGQFKLARAIYTDWMNTQWWANN